MDQVEATYILDVVKELLEFVFVRPIRQRRMRDRLERKKRGEAPSMDTQGDVVVASVLKAPAMQDDDDGLPF